MEIRVTIDSLNPNEVIERKQNVKFDTFDIKQYKKMFEQLVEGNHVIGSFDQPHWKLPCNIADHPMIVSFDIEVYHKFNTALKAYSIVRLLSGRTPIAIYNELALIKKAILESNGFTSSDKLESLLELQSQTYKYQGYRMSIDIKRFLSFYKVTNYKEIIDICSNHQTYKGTARELPAFEDIMIFDDIVNDYFQNHPTEETLEYFPIMLWWLLTNTLPMRPTEFLLLEKDCLQFNENYASPYRITIPRIKNKSNSPGFELRMDSIEIDEKAYIFIKNAIQLLETIDSESRYLFPVELLWAYRKVKIPKKNERINRRDFDLLKKHFYEKVVEGIYGKYDLERIKSGDTRHFAIINMALQGFNMLSIARMAGHDVIKSQFSYYSHAEHFAQSYVYRLAQKRVENTITSDMSSGIFGWKRYVYDKGKSIDINTLENIVGRVKHGYCTEQKDVFPETCIEHCEFCSNYVFKPSLNEQTGAITWLSDSSRSLEGKIRESIELMKDLSMNLSKIYRQGNDDLLKSTSRNLMAYMDMKAMIDSKVMGADAFGQEQ
ncbi:tyrosine-type recombinase/integrase [Sporosarcina saromensis]|uniref:Tyrosine-type recombinase/integrase n=1 Tax=Sporosarcina saromensis TaxID=359365 RepID=A0ABU4GED4_9BACL|nr:tyrosine-type recombinase/integrase [Sporosarcina saromensis]MDW0115308.1 tyrosine-type recombinase/integrase [Sporosarcina saromensis]